jgi:hypothetical protein
MRSCRVLHPAWSLVPLALAASILGGCGRALYEAPDDAQVSGLDASLTDVAPLDAGLPDAGLLEAGPPDAGLLDAGLPDARLPDAASPPLVLGPVFESVVLQSPVNTDRREFGVAMSPDGLRIVFASYPGSAAEPMNANLYFGSRPGPADLFSGRTLVTDASSDLIEAEPVWALGGTEIYFDRGGDSGIRRCVVAGDACTGTASILNLETFGGADVSVGDTRLVVSRDGDLYEAVRASRADPWPAPTLLVELSGPDVDGFPSLRGDGLEIFWERSGALAPSIWRAVRPSLDAPFGAPEPVTFAGFSGATGDPDIDDSGTLMVFVGLPDGGTAEFDIYLARRTPL